MMICLSVWYGSLVNMTILKSPYLGPRARAIQKTYQSSFLIGLPIAANFSLKPLNFFRNSSSLDVLFVKENRISFSYDSCSRAVGSMFSSKISQISRVFCINHAQCILNHYASQPCSQKCVVGFPSDELWISSLSNPLWWIWRELQHQQHDGPASSYKSKVESESSKVNNF